jgi:alpha-galactosidase
VRQPPTLLAMRAATRITLTAALMALLFALPAQARDAAISPRPPMGWNSWYAYGCQVTEQQILDNARALVDSGMAAAGYRYVNVDGCWEASTRSANGELQADPATFPSGMAELGRRIHAMGLKFGIYTSAGSTICLHEHPGSYGHFGKDFKTFARWKVDYVKVDWCNPAPGQHLKTAYPGIARAARRSGRRMITTVSTPGISKPWKWGAPYGSSWRIAPDLNGTWESVLSVLDADAPLWRYAGPGGWNDADILQVGNGRLTPDEDRAHFGMWNMVASPLLAGNRLPDMTPEVRATLLNRDVIAVGQDRLGRQARRVRRSGGVEVWVKQLAAGKRRCRAVAVLNRNPAEREVKVDLRTLRGMPDAARFALRDLWLHEDSQGPARLTLRTAAHGIRMVRACPR